MEDLISSIMEHPLTPYATSFAAGAVLTGVWAIKKAVTKNRTPEPGVFYPNRTSTPSTIGRFRKIQRTRMIGEITKAEYHESKEYGDRLIIDVKNEDGGTASIEFLGKDLIEKVIRYPGENTTAKGLENTKVIGHYWGSQLMAISDIRTKKSI